MENVGALISPFCFSFAKKKKKRKKASMQASIILSLILKSMGI